jgi:transposase
VKAPRTIRALFSVPGFVAQAQLAGVFGDRYARVIRLRRRKSCALRSVWWAVPEPVGSAALPRSRPVGGRVADLRGVRALAVNCPRCGGVYVERLDWLAKNPCFTQRYAMHVGALCREMTNKAVAELEHLHDSTVKDLDKIYMQKRRARRHARAAGHRRRRDRDPQGAQLPRGGERPRPGRPIWVGGQGRTEADLDRFFAALGAKKTARIELAAMDMWKPFRNSLKKNAPQARIVFNKFHIMRHLADALDEVRRSEYRRLAGKDRAFIKGQRYTLLSSRRT